jgi:membrane-associated PAP2 superfamily phosphatase
MKNDLVNQRKDHKIKKVELLIPLIITAIVTIVSYYSSLDLTISAYFYDQNSSTWPFGEYRLIKGIFVYLPYLITFIFLLSIVGIIVSYTVPAQFYIRSQSLFVFLAILLIPGIAVHGLLKDTWKRPRPRDTINFNGNHKFAKILVIQDSDFIGRSFPSGHSTAGFILILSYFLTKKRSPKKALYYLLLSLAMGIYVSFARIAAGAHFFSDTVWSFYLSWFGVYLLYYYWFEDYLAKHTKKEPFSYSHQRVISLAGILILLFTATFYIGSQIVDYDERLADYKKNLPANIKVLKVKVRAEKGDIHIFKNGSNSLKITMWGRGSGPRNLTIKRTIKIDQKENIATLAVTLKPSTWFWKYQSHTDIYVPKNIEAKWDVKTKLGSVFTHQ